MRKIGFENVYRRFLRESCNIASVQRVGFYEAASCNMVIAVQLSDPSPGQAWQALHAVAGYEPSMGKIVVAVDDDIDLEDLESVLWALSYRTQPAKDSMVIGGRLPRLDPSATTGSEAASSSALLIDATRGRPYPPTSLPARPYMEEARRLWDELGLPGLSIGGPWYGTDYGGWTDENRAEAELAVQGRYLETGKKLTVHPREGGSHA
jgi:4-hydroxy-3-polyprenylbenzoate decarboxylase